MKDNHGTWMGPGYYRIRYSDNSGDPGTVYWISDNETANGKGMWVCGSDEYPWEPVKVIARPRPKKVTGPHIDLKR